MKLDIWFVLLCISIILITGLGIYILRIRNKRQIHYVFLGLIISIFIWGFSLFLASLDNFSNMLFVYSYFVGVCFVPVSITFLGLVFSHTKIDFNWKHTLLFIFPVIDLIIILTNPYHHLFFVKYHPINTLMEYGMFFRVHTIVSYIYILVGIWYLLYYSIKNSSFFSRQSLLIILGVFVPLVLNALENLNIIKLSTYTTPVAFSFAIVCFTFAILKFQFLNVVPVAMQKIVDLISDSFVVINEDYKIVDFNQTLISTFGSLFNFKRNQNLIAVLSSNSDIDMDTIQLMEYIKRARYEKKTISYEKHIESGEFIKHFAIEITPLIYNNQNLGTIILFKDITELKESIEKIKRAQNQLVERERLASLGELIGGIAHDINSPLSSLQCHVKEIHNLSREYEESIEDPEVTPDDHREIAHEIQDNLNKIEKICGRIANIINSVRNNTRNLSAETYTLIDLSYVIEDLKILLGHELRHGNCEIVYKEDKHTMLMGDPGKLGQVLTNLITNAIQAYEGKPGTVTVEARNTEKEVIISVSDQGEGIRPEIREGVFKKILSTKGTKGTGMGLYISYSIITGHFGGRMWLESETGKGTTFFIALPKDFGKKEHAS